MNFRPKPFAFLNKPAFSDSCCEFALFSQRNHKESTVVIYAIIGSFFLVTVGGQRERMARRGGEGGEREKTSTRVEKCTF